jgi:hypothetical protein
MGVAEIRHRVHRKIDCVLEIDTFVNLRGVSTVWDISGLPVEFGGCDVAYAHDPPNCRFQLIS